MLNKANIQKNSNTFNTCGLLAEETLSIAAKIDKGLYQALDTTHK